MALCLLRLSETDLRKHCLTIDNACQNEQRKSETLQQIRLQHCETQNR
jgi:hypothetical protein